MLASAFPLLSILPLLASAAPRLHPRQTNSTNLNATDASTPAFGLKLLSDNPVFQGGRWVDANDNGFFVGENTESYCPLPEGQCPKGDFTDVYIDGTTAWMNSSVPGGQPIFIGPNGALNFTSGHHEGLPYTANYTMGPFTIVNGLFAYNGCTDWQACKVPDSLITKKQDRITDVYQIFADVPYVSPPAGSNVPCLKVNLQTGVTTFEHDGAWQYGPPT